MQKRTYNVCRIKIDPPKVAITSIGTANPVYINSQNAIADLMIKSLSLTSTKKRLLHSIFNATGIEKRYSVLNDFCKSPEDFTFFPNKLGATFPGTKERMRLYKDNALLLSLSAIEECISSLEHMNKNNITHLITVSCTGMYAPGLDIEIIQQLKLKSSINRTAINFMGCYGAFNAIKVADAICKSHSQAAVLIVCVEICSIHFQDNITLDNIIANSIFADGAAAILVESRPNTKKYFTLENFYNDLLPSSESEMTWFIGDQGFEIGLSKYVPTLIQSGIKNFLSWFQQYGLTLSDIAFYAIHPGGLKILEACEKALEMSKEDNRYSYHILRDYGNMSSATVLFVLKAIWDDIKESDHEKNVFSCAFGPGLTMESMVLKIVCL